jgi:hypothetical protein
MGVFFYGNWHSHFMLDRYPRNIMFAFVRSKSYLLGFLTGLFFVALVNTYTAYPDYEAEQNSTGDKAATEEFDAYKEIGWPFRFHRSGTILHLDETSWPELMADIAIAICIGNITGAVSYFLTVCLMSYLQMRKEKVE